MLTAYQKDLLDMGQTPGFRVINNDGNLIYGKEEKQIVNGVGIIEFPYLGCAVFVLSVEKTIDDKFIYPKIENLLLKSANKHNTCFHNSYISCDFNYLFTDNIVYNIDKKEICSIRQSESEDTLLHFTEFFQLGRKPKIKIINNYNKTEKKQRAYSNIVNAVKEICELSPLPNLSGYNTYDQLLKYYGYNNDIKRKKVICKAPDIQSIPEYIILSA